jgi:hypothetical protein
VVKYLSLVISNGDGAEGKDAGCFKIENGIVALQSKGYFVKYFY